MLSMGSMFEEAFNMIQGVKYLFGDSLDFISINTDKTLTTGQLESIISGINSMNQASIHHIVFEPHTMKHLEVFLRNYQKPTEHISIERLGFSRFEASQPLEAAHFRCDSLKVSNWGSFEQLFAYDCIYGDFFFNLTNEELHVFLKSWQEGKTHLRMERFTFQDRNNRAFIMNTVLDGLSPIFEHPRIIGDNQGLCKIQRNDGKIAKLQFNMLRTGQFSIDID